MAHALPPIFTAFADFSQWPMNAPGALSSASSTCSPSSPVPSRTPPSPLACGGTSSNFISSWTHVEGEAVLQQHLLKKRIDLGCDLIETKTQFKEFSKLFRMKQKDNWRAAYLFALESFESFPPKMHWKICLELADLSKRKNLIDIARFWYRKVNLLQPFAVQGWIEFAKLEEEAGYLEACRTIIRAGLVFVPFHETLMVKLLKLEERSENLQAARECLAQLQGVSGEKSFKAMFEGALMESRAGNIMVARKVLRFLMHYMRWYGPVYHAAFSLEERHGNYFNAKQIVERGLLDIPRYGPLWFGAFRLYEKLNIGEQILRSAIENAAAVISKELIWKVYFEAAQIAERQGNFEQARADYVRSVKYCPKNLKWKVWLGGARTELKAGRIDVARLLLNRSVNEVPQKTRAMVLLECARLEEFAGNVERAREILSRARLETCYEWKVFLETVMLEIRCGNIAEAIEAAKEALVIHSGTGRLWAVLIQLSQFRGPDEQLRIFKQAYQEVPKSGEVWCEGARIHLDPTSPHFSLETARRYLSFAVRFTPQYGDSFVEFIRLEALEKGLDYQCNELVKQCVNADPNYGAMWFRCKDSVLDTALEVLGKARAVVLAELHQHRSLYQRALVGSWARSVKLIDSWRAANMNSLELLYPCVSSLPVSDRHRLLFGSSASFHE